VFNRAASSHMHMAPIFCLGWPDW